MAHCIEGDMMIWTGERPWHNIGRQLPRHATRLELGIALPEFEERLSLEPTTTTSGLEIPDQKAVVWTARNKVVSTVGNRYRILQDSEMADFACELVGGAEQALFETAAILDGRKRTFILIKLPQTVEITGRNGNKDVTEMFLLLTNSHDGSSPLIGILTPIRVVCQNTLSMALTGGKQEGFRIRHTETAQARVDEARNSLGIALKGASQFNEMAQFLARAPFSDKQMISLADHLFPKAQVVNGRASTRSVNNREKVIELFTTGKGHSNIEGTAWAALNAVAEYSDHVRSTRLVEGADENEAKLTAAWFGSGLAMKQTAYNWIAKEVNPGSGRLLSA